MFNACINQSKTPVSVLRIGFQHRPFISLGSWPTAASPIRNDLPMSARSLALTLCRWRLHCESDRASPVETAVGRAGVPGIRRAVARDEAVGAYAFGERRREIVTIVSNGGDSKKRAQIHAETVQNVGVLWIRSVVVTGSSG
jgi:hypothetical protein